jgi:Cu+-exporting ATPase
MIGEWVFGLGLTVWFRWVAFLLASIVQVFGGAPFYRGAWAQLKSRSSNMDTLVALGSTTAFLFSAWALLSGIGGHLYFMESAAIITVISAGHWMESRVSVRASSALHRLMDLAPESARRLNADGQESVVTVADLTLGDKVALRPGDRIPVDGDVIEGDSAVDESMLTGESIPADKTTDAKLFAGTINLNGRLIMKVTAVGEATALAHVIAAVQRAQNSRANIQRLGDQVSSVFVPIVVIIALAAALWWGLAPASAHLVHESLARYLWAAHPPRGSAAGFIIAAAVLIIACPCAMGLATPAAIMAGTNAAAKRGILIRDGVALEKAGTITAVVFDKTGTLTSGKPHLAAFWELPLATKALHAASNPKGYAIEIASNLARNSTHPISLALAGERKGDLPLSNWQEIRGAGIQAQIQWQEQWKPAQLGSLRWLADSDQTPAPAQDFIREWASQGASLVGLALDQKLIGIFALNDSIKAGAAEVVQRLHRHGLQIYLLTGDNRLTADTIANQVGIPSGHVFAEVRPEKKAEFVRQLQESGHRIAFVGDGINDAPALEQADLGIAVSKASDIAREAADIILLKSEIEAVPESLGLARATLRTIKQNLFWAFFYNVVGIPLAALGFMSPVLCAAAMGLSDLVVIGNALRLQRWRL